jgi:hypothetical protein
VHVLSQSEAGTNGILQVGLVAAGGGSPSEIMAANIKLSVKFTRGVNIGATWGFSHTQKANTLSYTIPGIQRGQNKTVFIYFTIPPAVPIQKLADIDWAAGTPAGDPRLSGTGVAYLDPAAGLTPTGSYIDTMVKAAQAIYNIGAIYYDTGAKLQDRLNMVISESSENEGRIRKAQKAIRAPDVLKDEYNLLQSYEKRGRAELAKANAAGGSDDALAQGSTTTTTTTTTTTSGGAIRGEPHILGMPKADDGKRWTVQVAATTTLAGAQQEMGFLLRSGLKVQIEEYGGKYRVVIPDVSYDDLSIVVQKVAAAGYKEIWVR